MDALKVQIASHLANVVDVRVGRLGGACMWYYGQRKGGPGDVTYLACEHLNE
jgi:hypothetical protein